MRIRPSLSAFLLGASGMALLAQGTQTASILGVAVDPRGNPVPLARVRATSEALQGARLGTTDAAGRFSLVMLPPGPYTFEVTQEGRQTAILRQHLGVGQVLHARMVLPEGPGSTVEVRALPPEVDLTEVQTAVNRRMTEDIKPLPAEQNLDDVLQTFTAGVADPGVNAPRIRGAMSTGNIYLVDGQNIQDGFQQASGISLIEDAIQEVEVISGAIPAEYGQVEGGVVNAVTPSGGNTFKGYLRFELDDNTWNASLPLQDRSSIISHLNAQRSLTLGGPILKDELWFFVAAYGVDGNQPGSITGNALAGPGAQGTGYSASSRESRFQGKLTWALNLDHTLILNLDHSVLDLSNQDPTSQAGSVAALVPVNTTYGFYNLDWRWVLSPVATFEARAGEKFQDLTQGAAPAGGTPILNTTDGLVYGNGLFSAGDGGQHYDTRTGNLKASLAWDGAGSHVTRAGLDWREDLHRARADGSPTGAVAEVADLDLAAGTAQGLQLDTYRTYGGNSTTTTWGLWVDDRWSLSPRAFLQLGARVDRYTAAREDGTTTASATSFSPRLGSRFDLTGSGDWLLGASYAQYTGRVLQTYLDQVTHQGNPTVISYAYTGPAGTQAIPALQNPALYGPGYAGYSDPALNVRLDPGLRPPTVDEAQLSLTRNLRGTAGEGFLRATLVRRSWHDLIDYRIGNDGTVADPTGTAIYVKTWYNDPQARREYRDLELEGAWKTGPWNLSGHLTWASLRGNYEGEQPGQPGTGEGLQAWSVQNGVQMFNPALFHPYGNLVGDTPMRTRLFAHYTGAFLGGQATWGGILRHVSGLHYDQVRTVATAVVNPALSPQAGSTFTQYLGRGTGVFPSQTYLDLSCTQTWEVWKHGGVPVSFYVKFVVTDAFNHIQQVSWNTDYAPLTVPGTSLATPFQPAGPGFGQALSSADYAESRSWVVHIGLKF